jgi:hypothetical protein
VKSYWFLFWACTVLWSFLAGFLLLMLVRLSRAEAKMRRIERGIEGRQD